MTVFIDSGGWLSVALPSDRYHGIGRQYFQSLISRRAVATTSDFVLQEVITRLRYDVGHRIASEFIALIHDLVVSTREVEVTGLFILFVGAGIGAIGSALAVRRFLDV